MSMPQPFTIVIADARGITSPAITAALGGPGHQGTSPYILPASAFGNHTLSHALAHLTATRGLVIMPAISIDVIDPREVDLWIVVDHDAEAVVRRRVREAGPPPDNFYRSPFPDPVVGCGLTIPTYSYDRASVEEWYGQVAGLLAPWKKRIMDAFSDSS